MLVPKDASRASPMEGWSKEELGVLPSTAQLAQVMTFLLRPWCRCLQDMLSLLILMLGLLLWCYSCHLCHLPWSYYIHLISFLVSPLNTSTFCLRPPINHQELSLESWWRWEHGTYFACSILCSIERVMGLLVPGAVCASAFIPCLPYIFCNRPPINHQELSLESWWRVKHAAYFACSILWSIERVMGLLVPGAVCAESAEICTSPSVPCLPCNFWLRTPISHQELSLESWWRGEHGTYFVCSISLSIDWDTGLLVPGAVCLYMHWTLKSFGP